MWNSNSRRWLVINEERLKEHAFTSTKTTRLCPNLYFYSKKKCRTLDTIKLGNKTVASQLSPSISIKTKTRTRTLALEKGAPFRVKPCPNQIIVVILNVLLANCLISSLANMPTAGAAFGAELIDDDDGFDLFAVAPLAANYRNRHSNLLHHEDYQQNLHFNNNNNNNNYYGDQKSANQLPRSQNFKISPKPCSIGRIEGTCMFVWECIKSEGRHVGMCVDSFMFGSCCSHNASDNIVQSETFSYTRPTKPVGMSSVNHRPRPPHYPQRPSISGMTTIERPHGAGTLVIRPSGPHHQGVLFKPQPTKIKPTYSQQPTTLAPTTKNPNSAVSFDMQSAASIPATNMWHTSPQTTHQHHWQLPTEPNFITKPRPPSWEKPTSMRPKPSKPTKKPIVHHEHTVQQQQPPPHTVATQSTGKPATTTTKPKPQVFSTKPMKTTTTTTRPYFRPTAGWANSESTLSSTFSTTSGNYTSSAFSSSSSTTQLYTKPPASPVTQPQQLHHLITTRPPAFPAASTSTSTTASSSSSSASTSSLPPSTPTATSTASMQHQHHHQHQQHHQQTPSTLNLSTMESNEIVDSSPSDTKLATIKTITAARSECGIPVLQRPETRIVGGKSAPFGRWPWQVSVRRTSFFGFSSTHRCGGALINENWIATAGHCVDDLLISQIRIRVGEYDFSHVQEQLPYIERGVSKKVVHPKYNFFTYEYDLALVKLEQPLEFAPHVSPICLPQTDSLLIGMNATVTGWGRLSEGGTLPSVLQEVSVPIVSNDNCKTMFLRAGRQEFIPDIFLCAGYETGGQDSCQGDSGGPLQVKSQDGRFFLAGIISWGIGCAEANLPGVCTRISKFVPWIMENVT